MSKFTKQSTCRQLNPLNETYIYIYIYLYIHGIQTECDCDMVQFQFQASMHWTGSFFLLEDRVPFSLRDLDRWLIDFHHWLELGSHIADQFEINLKAMGFYFRYHSASRSAPFASQLNPSFSDLSCLRTVWMLSILSRSACKSASS